MRWLCFLIITAALMGGLATPVSADAALTISSSPHQAHIGDVVTLNGTVTGITTIAVYLFVTGPDLDPRGVTLENLNIPAGRGLFTTAPVDLTDSSWTYTWDTSVILGEIKPGIYTVYVVSSPLDRLRYPSDDYASTDVEFLASDGPINESPPTIAIPVLALVIAALLGMFMSQLQVKK
ncbi:MAG: hypothetical protein LUQ04_00050 [Methanoregula sp.]|nr:hypothetical protein [Methanoregula sp.]